MHGLAASLPAAALPLQAAGRQETNRAESAAVPVTSTAASVAGCVNGVVATGKASNDGSGLQGGSKPRGEGGRGTVRTKNDGIARYSWRYVGICSDETWVAALLVDGTRTSQQRLQGQHGGVSCWGEEELSDVPKGYAIPV